MTKRKPKVIKPLRFTVAGNGCHEFAGCRLPKGYGKLRRSGKLWLAHRFAWTSANGPIPNGLCVLHHCDNPCCINVDHLFLGTATDNTQDMIRKGRDRFEGFKSPNCRPPPLRGERNGRAKLTYEKVKEIRSLHGSMKQTDMAALFSVSIATIGRVLARTGWPELSMSEGG